LTAVFIPARSASIPNITTPKELLTANALSAATWSTLLAVGAALGGFATDWFGIRAVFLIDSATFVVSAWFLYRAVIPQRTDRSERHGIAAVLSETVDGWRHIRHNPAIGRMVGAKAVWSLGGGGLVYMLALMGEDIASLSAAVGIGILYGARGFGTGVGPVVMRRFLPDESKWPLMLGLGIAATGVIYMTIGFLPWTTLWIAVPVALAHAPSGANWVASTVLLQERTIDEYRGRVFSTEWLLITLADSVSILVASLLLETDILTLRTGLLAFGALQVVGGWVWIVLVVPPERAMAEAAS
jgi:MFS family permease